MNVCGIFVVVVVISAITLLQLRLWDDDAAANVSNEDDAGVEVVPSDDEHVDDADDRDESDDNDEW